MSSFFAQIMEPGGGVKLLPFVRFVITVLFILTVIGAIVDVARIHVNELYLSHVLLFRDRTNVSARLFLTHCSSFVVVVVVSIPLQMIVLSCLSAGLLMSLAFFESEYNKLRDSPSRSQDQIKQTGISNTSGKTD